MTDQKYYSNKGLVFGKINQETDKLNYSLARAEHAGHISVQEYSDLTSLTSVIKQIIKAKQTGAKGKNFKLVIS